MVFAATSCVTFTKVNIAAIVFPISAFVWISKWVNFIGIKGLGLESNSNSSAREGA